MYTPVSSQSATPASRRPPPKPRQPPHRPRASPSSLGVSLVQSQVPGRGHMQPLPLAPDVHPRLIEVRHLRLSQALPDRFFHLPQLSSRILLCLVKCTL